MLEPPSTRSAPSSAWSVSTLPIPVLERDCTPRGGEEMVGGPRRLPGCVGVGEDDDQVGPTSASGFESLRRLGGGQAHDVLAERARDAESIAAYRLDVVAPCIDETHVFARDCEQPAVGAAHRPRSDHHDSHRRFSSPKVSHAHSNRLASPVQAWRGCFADLLPGPPIRASGRHAPVPCPPSIRRRASVTTALRLIPSRRAYSMARR